MIYYRYNIVHSKGFRWWEQNSLDLAWDNYDLNMPSELLVPLQSRALLFTTYDPLIGSIRRQPPAGIIERNFHILDPSSDVNRWLFDLNLADNLHDIYICYAGWDLDVNDDARFEYVMAAVLPIYARVGEWLNRIAPEDVRAVDLFYAREFLNWASFRLSRFLSSDDTTPYEVNDGFVPITSALLLPAPPNGSVNISLNELRSVDIGDGYSGGDGAPFGFDCQLMRLFPGYDHLSMVEGLPGAQPEDEALFEHVYYDLVGTITGTIVVNVYPSNASWTITGPETYRDTGGTTIHYAPTGLYTITYDPISGYITPNQQNRILNPGDTIEFIGEYETATGNIVVDVNLTGASWSITGPATYSGTGDRTITGAPTGTYTISFNPLSGYNTPTQPPKSLSSNGTITFTGNYTPSGTETGTIVVDVNLTGASWSITGPATYSGTGDRTITGAPTGTYTITFNPVSGYSTPTESPKTLTAGGYIEFIGDYEPEGESGIISIDVGLNSGSWTLTGPPGYQTVNSSGDWGDPSAPHGSYTITYNPIPGYTAPSAETLSIPEDTFLGVLWFEGIYQTTLAPITPTTIDFGSDPGGSTRTFEIENNLGRDVRFFVGLGAQHSLLFGMDPLTGFLPSGSSIDITVSRSTFSGSQDYEIYEYEPAKDDGGDGYPAEEARVIYGTITVSSDPSGS